MNKINGSTVHSTDTDHTPLLAQAVSLIKSWVPEANESKVYGVTGLTYHNKNLAAFLIAKNHFGYYPMSPVLISRYANELNKYSTSKGTIRFSYNQPLPWELIKSIILDRVAEIDSAA